MIHRRRRRINQKKRNKLYQVCCYKSCYNFTQSLGYKITVLETKCFPELQKQYLVDPKSGPCPFFKPGDTFLLKRTPQQDDFYHLMNGKFCGEAWDAVSRYVYTALQGDSIMKGWTNDDRMMIACCNDGTRPVIFKIERIDIPENEEEEAWLQKQNFTNTADNAYTG